MKEKLTLFLVALVILWGQHPGFSESQQIKELHQAAEQGDAETQFSLGQIYSFGRGVPQDEEQAAKWYRYAAEQGNSRAQFMLGEMYAGGQGTPEDHVRAYAWLNLAAAQCGLTGRKAGRIKDTLSKQRTVEQLAQAETLANELRERVKASKSR